MLHDENHGRGTAREQFPLPANSSGSLLTPVRESAGDGTRLFKVRARTMLHESCKRPVRRRWWWRLELTEPARGDRVKCKTRKAHGGRNTERTPGRSG